MEDEDALRKHFEGKNILVTGGTGSIGSLIVERLLDFSPKVIRILSNDENVQFHLEQSLKSHTNLRFLLGDIRDKDRMVMAMEGVDIVFNAAALKHVPLGEYNPFELVKTNVIGTQNVIEATMDREVEQMVHISTDKVVNAINTLGATKLLSEKLVVSANHYKGRKRTVFFCIRLGNVFGSRGSLLDTIVQQIRRKNCPIITDKRMTRFMIGKRVAVDMILKTCTTAQDGNVFVLKMPSAKVADLVEIIIEEYSKIFPVPSECTVKETGLRAGEKLHEELMTRYEHERAIELDSMYVIPSELEKRVIIPKQQANLTSEEAPKLSDEEIRSLVKEGLQELTLDYAYGKPRS